MLFLLFLFSFVGLVVHSSCCLLLLFVVAVCCLLSLVFCRWFAVACCRCLLCCYFCCAVVNINYGKMFLQSNCERLVAFTGTLYFWSSIVFCKFVLWNSNVTCPS